MPKGIKKPTEKSLREAIEKQERAIHDKEIALTKAKEEYDAKVKHLKNEIAAGKTNLTKLRKEYDDFIRNEQQATLSTMLFNSDLSSAEVTKAINAMKALLEKMPITSWHSKCCRVLPKRIRTARLQILSVRSNRKRRINWKIRSGVRGYLPRMRSRNRNSQVLRHLPQFSSGRRRVHY